VQEQTCPNNKTTLFSLLAVQLPPTQSPQGSRPTAIRSASANLHFQPTNNVKDQFSLLTKRRMLNTNRSWWSRSFDCGPRIKPPHQPLMLGPEDPALSTNPLSTS
jgi:hypothetical protein